MMSKLLLVAVVAGASARVLPPGIANFASSTLTGLQDYELDLHPPQDDARVVADQLNALRTIESAADKQAESDLLASKQRLLNAEIASIRSIVAANVHRSSFLQRTDGMFSPASLYGSMVGHSDFQLSLHPHEEIASDIKSQTDAILRAEDSRQASESAAFVADKKRILQAGLGELRRIVADAAAPAHGKFSGLSLGEKMVVPVVVPIVAKQTAWQAGLPTEVHVNYDVPSYGLAAELEAIKANA